MFFCGQFIIIFDRVCKGICYKYVVVKKGEVYWEDLLEFLVVQYNGIVDWLFKILEKYLKFGGK